MDCLKISVTFQGTGDTVMNTRGKVPEALESLTSSKIKTHTHTRTRTRTHTQTRKISDRNTFFEEFKR